MEYEVLAPVGRMVDLMPMIEAGADAVYVGLKGFSSRPDAVDLNLEEIKTAIEICRQNHVKIYVAVNAYISHSNIPTLLEQIYSLDKFGADAVILSEFGLINHLNEKLKNMTVHASTLLGAYNIETVLALKDIGVKRIILSANLYFDEIAAIINAVPELEYELVAEGGTCFNDIKQCALPHTYLDGIHTLSCRNGYSLCENGKKTKAKAICEYPTRAAEIVGIYMAAGIKSFKVEGRTVESKYRTDMVRDLKKYIRSYQNGLPLKSYLHYLSRANREDG